MSVLWILSCLSVAIIYIKSIFYKISNLYSYDETSEGCSKQLGPDNYKYYHHID